MQKREMFLNWTVPSAVSTRICSSCQKTMIICSCLKRSRSFVNQNDDNSLYITSPLQDVLDIEAIEAQPGNNLDIYAPMCEKSYEHDNFISIDNFDLTCLPKDIRHPATYAWLRCCTHFVVRLLSDVAATGRACLIPQDIGKSIECNSMQCPYLLEFGQNHKLYGGIGIITNKHVVQSDDDAAMTMIEFFYNSDERRHLVRKELGYTVHSTNRKMDHTFFRCYVHSQDLIEIIALFDKLRDFAWLQIPQHIRLLARKYAIVISHPHGAAKMISIGHIIERQIRCTSPKEYENVLLLRNIYNLCEQNNGLLRFEVYYSLSPDIEIPFTVTWYSTATCKGSSGAPVYMGNVVIENGQEINQAHTHRGVDKSKGYNNCFT